ncbi:hypothetical protein JW906_04455, partial [bacterium]|nr:hypothetical protein [bacterium]
VVAPPGSISQVAPAGDIGDYIDYDPARLNFGVTLAVPGDFRPLFGALSRLQFSMDYQITFPNKQIPSDVFNGEIQLVRPTYKNATIRIRKQVGIRSFRTALFVEMRNAFNDKWIHVDAVEDARKEDRAAFINSNMSKFPETEVSGAPFLDVIQYLNLPRQIQFGLSVDF